MRRRAERAPRALSSTAVACATIAAALLGCAGAVALAGEQPDTARIVAIGDLHGDLDATRRALRLAGAIDARDRWIGGPLVVVQTGDQLDRGDQERAILHLFDRLAREAARAGGAVHALNGNHELMNAQLDLRYVTPAGFRDFEGAVLFDAENDPLLARFPARRRARVAAFRPGGPYARMLARRNTILQIGENIFVHGGVLPVHAEYGIERINQEIRAWLRGERAMPAYVDDSDSPVWTRLYSRNVGPAACAALDSTLAMLDARRMIVGHSVHSAGITAYCNERVWVVDVGLAAYYGGPLEVLEIRGNTVRPLRGHASR